MSTHHPALKKGVSHTGVNKFIPIIICMIESILPKHDGVHVVFGLSRR